VNGAAIDAGRWFFGGSSTLLPLAFMIGVMVLSALVLDRRLRSGEGGS
jgi:hypothetical protein